MAVNMGGDSDQLENPLSPANSYRQRRIGVEPVAAYQGRGTLEHTESLARDECRANHLQIQDGFAAAKECLFDPRTTAQDLAVWVQQLTEDKCARMRETSSLWKTWHRLQEHRALTGHYVALLPVLPNAISNTN
jgi:hypothetical protein